MKSVVIFLVVLGVAWADCSDFTENNDILLTGNTTNTHEFHVPCISEGFVSLTEEGIPSSCVSQHSFTNDTANPGCCWLSFTLNAVCTDDIWDDLSDFYHGCYGNGYPYTYDLKVVESVPGSSAPSSTSFNLVVKMTETNTEESCPANS